MKLSTASTERIKSKMTNEKRFKDEFGMDPPKYMFNLLGNNCEGMTDSMFDVDMDPTEVLHKSTVLSWGVVSTMPELKIPGWKFDE